MAWKENELTHTIGSDDDETRCGCQSEVDNLSHNGQVPREGNELPQQLDGNPALSREQLIEDQQSDPELATFIENAFTEEEAQNQPICYFLKSGILMRKWRPPTIPSNEEWKVSYQIVVPPNHRTDVLKLAHTTPMAGHLARLTNVY